MKKELDRLDSKIVKVAKELISDDLVNANTSELKSWLAMVQDVTNKDYAENYPHSNPPVFETMVGPRYIRIVRREPHNSGRSSYAFINRENGDILKSASWSAPAKHPRGNIFSPDNGKSAMSGRNGRYL